MSDTQIDPKIPLYAPNALAAQPTPADRLAQFATTQNALQTNQITQQNFNAQKAVGAAMQAATDPTTGQLDTGKASVLISQDPTAAPLAADAIKSIYANKLDQMNLTSGQQAQMLTTTAVFAVITTPTLRPDGSVLLEPGYDAATRLYYEPDPSLQMPTLSDRPSRYDAENALELLLCLLESFPFTSPVSKAVGLSMLITPVIRGALSVTPLHAAKASTAGTGKSYLVDLASAISTGRPCPVAAAATNADETEKRLIGLLLSAFPIISLDNVNGELGGDVLCQAVERPLIRVRPLGRSEIIEIESRACLYATGNNLRVCGDMVRRTLLAILDAEMERLETREFTFDPMAAVLADRGVYVAACLTIVRAYTAAGSPGRLVPLASFQDWSDLVRSALVWLGQDDPCKSMEEAREDDPELTDLREMMSAWQQAFGTDPMTVRKAAEEATMTVRQADENGDIPTHGATTGDRYPELRDVFMRLSGVRGGVDGTRIGRWLLAHEGRIISMSGFPRGLRFVRDGLTRGSARWRLKPGKANE